MSALLGACMFLAAVSYIGCAYRLARPQPDRALIGWFVVAGVNGAVIAVLLLFRVSL